MAFTYVKAGRKPSTVTVEPADGSVTVVTREGNHAPAWTTALARTRKPRRGDRPRPAGRRILTRCLN